MESNENEEISPAAMPNYLTLTWSGSNGESIIKHNVDTHRIISSEEAIPSEYTIEVKINSCSKLDYCMLGLVEEQLNNEGKSYLGEKGLGIVGFCFSNVTSLEGEWKWHNTKIVEGDILTITGDYKEVKFMVGSTIRQELQFSREMKELYLAANLYGNLEFEILAVIPNKSY